ncbi:cardioactive peptide [Cydia pomonella]|uniref:Crustacean cardioactive peptide n=1 Tax=Cydia pomonella TaxID=82600 RepID=A0A514YLL0_CYDPO|nr:cardioactive peptide [Cydia pomonella]XP_061725929.1 cardioactive peptide [Cydia pomonella]QDK59886.1 crustacean cardioactive peptide [Cydia pomonella]
MARSSLILPVLALLLIDACYSASIPRGFDPRLSEEVVMVPKKRPFCNAFTGCGRKRSQGSPGMPVQELMRQRQFVDDDTLPILESENGIDDLSRQIVSEAKLWEAIQEASAEIARRKQKEFQ